MNHRIFFFLLPLLALPVFSFAQTSALCNGYQSGTTPPAGYAAAWNVLSSGRELLLTGTCDFGANTSVSTVGTGASNQYVYKMRYYYAPNQSQWVETTLNGTFAPGSNDWLAGKGTLNATAPTIETLYWVGYVCQWQADSSTWKCGCRDAACATNYWSLQTMVNPNIGSGASGGSAGGNNTGGGNLPSATRTVNVASAAQLTTALNNAQPGDHIVLANGSYNGFTVEKSGTSVKPIVIRAANVLGAKVGNVTINGNYVWVMGMNAGGSYFLINGSYARFSRNYLKSGSIAV